MLINKKNN